MADPQQQGQQPQAPKPLFDMSKAEPIFDMSKAEDVNATPPAATTVRAMQQGIGGPPMYVDVPVPPGADPQQVKQQFESAGQKGYATGAKVGMQTVGAAAGPEVLGADMTGMAGALVRMFSSGVGGAIGNAAGQAGGTGTVNPRESLGVGAGSALGQGIGEGISALPNAARAGRAFQSLSESIGNHPVAVTDELSGNLNDLWNSVKTTNTNIPPVVRKLIDRLDPLQGGGALTYDEARAFSSEINQLSAADKMSMTSNTKRLVANLNHSLKDTVQNTADLADKGDVLSKAMSEYHHAMQLRNVSDMVKEDLWRAVLTGAGAYGLKRIWDAGAGGGKQ